tara:strand:+ start:1424 stop:2818 length:1395 start_codon:yes stop_codon:yes gene_type:complete
MSFAGLLGAGLLGGVANAAKGVGDKLREEAKQKRAMALQAQVRQDNFDLAKQKQGFDQANIASEAANASALQAQGAGELADQTRLTGNDLEGKFSLEDKRAGIQSAQTLLEGSQTRINTKFSQDNAGLIAKAELELRALLKIADNSDLAAIRKAEIKLQGAIDTAKAAVAATVATKAKTVANERAVTAAGVKAGVDAEAAKQVAATNTATAGRLGMVQYEIQEANNAAALERVNAAKVGQVHTFYDADKGLEYKGITQEDGSIKMEGGTKAPSTDKSSITLQTIELDGKNVSGYMNGTSWVTVGGAVSKKDSKGDFDAVKATDYFTKQAWIHAGIKTGPNGFPEAASEEDSALVAGWVDEAMKDWEKGDKKQPSSIVNSTFYKPLNRDKIEVTEKDLATARKSNKDAGLDEEDNLDQLSKDVAMARYEAVISAAQKKINSGADFILIAKRLREMGIDPRMVKRK